MYKAILFDLDGTILDSAIDLYDSLVILLKRHHQKIPEFEAIRPYCGQGGSNLVPLMFKRISEDVPIEQLIKEYETIFISQNYKKTITFPSINQMLSNLNATNTPWGIVTNRLTTTTIPLPSSIVYPASGVIVCGDSVARAKGYPDPLLHACKKLNVNPKDTLYIGDSLKDCQAAKSAGMDMCLAKYGYIPPDSATAAWPIRYSVESPEELIYCINKCLN